MSELILRLALYAYPLWALIAFAVALAHFVEYFYLEPSDKSLALWGAVFLAWSIAFFGAGLLIAQVVDRAIATPYIQGIWIVALPIFAVAAGIRCWRLWRRLEKVKGRKRP